MAIDWSALVQLLIELTLTDTTDRFRQKTERPCREFSDAEPAVVTGAGLCKRG